MAHSLSHHRLSATAPASGSATSPSLTATPSPIATSATSSATSDPLSFPAWDSPPQASYGWFVDVPPPRGPYLWPALPESYKLRPPPSSAAKDDPAQPVVPLGDASNESLFAYAPQLVFGWYCSVPPPQPPFLWPAIPEGYVLVRADEIDTTLSSSGGSIAAASSSTNGANVSTPQRQSSSVRANPLSSASNLPVPHTITQSPASQRALLSPPFIAPMFTPPVMPSMMSPLANVSPRSGANAQMPGSGGAPISFSEPMMMTDTDITEIVKPTTAKKAKSRR